jgi:para-nitrobenzyl esterase
MGSFSMPSLPRRISSLPLLSHLCRPRQASVGRARWGNLAIFFFILLSACSEETEIAALPVEVNCAEPVSSNDAVYTGARDVSACSWKGIPFGAPPVGELRFQYAQPAAVKGAIDATDFGLTCLQGTGLAVESYRTRQTFDEDCLNLNIWTPGLSADGKLPQDLPVMVWIYGGGFATGSGATNLYNGEPLTTHGVVVVTLNYRLGGLGWLAVTDATGADGKTLEGNYGLSDQIQALKWVQENIASFGGDPQNVTIFGESAGAYSVCALMASPKADGLIHRAIMESGSCIMAGQETHGDYSKQWIQRVGCPVTAPASLECLRDLDPQWIRENAPFPLFEIDAPVVGGEYLPKQPLEALQGGGRKVPLLVGFNADEVKLLGLVNRNLMRLETQSWPETWANIEAAVGKEATRKLQTAYSRELFPTPRDLIAQGATDVMFSCPARQAARAGNLPSYQYRFRIKPDSFFLEPYSGSFHASEIPFVFGNRNLLHLLFPQGEPYADAVRLAEAMQQYWTNFAKTGDPNGPGLPRWEPFDADEFLMELTTPLTTSAGEFQARCDAWDAVTPRELNTLFWDFAPSLIGADSIF